MPRQRSATLGAERSKENQHFNRSLPDDRDWVAKETGIAEHRDHSIHFCAHALADSSAYYHSRAMTVIEITFLIWRSERTGEAEGEAAERFLPHQTEEKEVEVRWDGCFSAAVSLCVFGSLLSPLFVCWSCKLSLKYFSIMSNCCGPGNIFEQQDRMLCSRVPVCLK